MRPAEHLETGEEDQRLDEHHHAQQHGSALEQSPTAAAGSFFFLGRMRGRAAFFVGFVFLLLAMKLDRSDKAQTALRWLLVYRQRSGSNSTGIRVRLPMPPIDRAYLLNR